jgi:hypothetical protein
VVVPPLPTLSRLIFIQMAEVAMWIAMGFYRPLVVEDYFIVIPVMTIMVVRIVVVSTTMLPAGCRKKRQCQYAGD